MDGFRAPVKTRNWLAAGMSGNVRLFNRGKHVLSVGCHMDILILAGSTRKASLNAALGRHIAALAASDDTDARFIDLSEFDMPMYNFDLEEAEGSPAAAVELHDLMRSAHAIVFVSPEYNGGPTPVLKNAIDWVSRVSKRPLEGKRVGLVSATPGTGGGVTGLAGMRLILTNMRANLPDADLSVGSARARLETSDPDLDAEITEFVDLLCSMESVAR